MKPHGLLILLGGLAVGPAAAAEPSEELLAACHRALPSAFAEETSPGALSGSTADGRWAVEASDLDGDGTVEALLVVLPAGRPGEVSFFAEREEKGPVRQKIKLKGRLARASVSFHSFDATRALVHVNGDDAGESLLFWTGKKLETVWDIGKARENESHWFDLEDLDGDGVSEVIAYYRRELDVFTNEDELAGSGGSDQTLTSGKVDAVAVYHFADEKWKKAKKLLESLR